MANTIKESKGVASQGAALTHRRCPVCQQYMRQNEISVEFVYRYERAPGEPKRERVLKHMKNCKAA